MVSYEEALAIARKLKPNIDACDEYDQAFLFKCKSEEWLIGGDGPVVVLKDTGKAIHQLAFFDSCGLKLIRSVDI
jgi:hypothetical protein